MSILNNKKTRLLFIFCIISTFISVFLCFGIVNFQNKVYNKKVNIVIANIVEEIKNKYPNVSEEEVLDILNADINKYNDSILSQYGFDENISSVHELEKYNKIFLIAIMLVVFISDAALIYIIYLYILNRKKNIDNLITYVDNINNKNYTLEIEDNVEDELNSLKNELYKLTVMLKSRTDDSLKEKEMVYNLVSDISHQLKTPLTSIQILLDNLNESKNMDEATRNRFIFEVSRKAESMNWLIKSLLKLSKIDAKAVEFKDENVNLNSMLEEIVNNLEIMAEVKNISIKLNTKENVNVVLDFAWNKEAIQNIVKNAIEHSKSTVKITLSDNKVYSKIEIEDNGEGISKKDIKHIFDRFYKSSNASEDSIGIGLALSKSIIEKQNGYIGVESKEGIGTKFVIKYIKN